MNIRAALHLAILSLASTAFAASASESIPDCVDLGNDQEIVRNSGGQQIFLRDSQNHYRIGFTHNCGSVMVTPSIAISTDGQQNRLCPSGSKVRTKRDTCDISAVEIITAEDFAKRKKRAAR